MQLAKVAELSGKAKEEVAKDFGIPTEGNYWLKQVDDAAAQAYIASQDEEGAAEAAGEAKESGLMDTDAVAKGPKMVRFWCHGGNYTVLGDIGREPIKFAKNLWEGAADSAEVAYLRSRRDYFIAQGVYEVYDYPHEKAMDQADFIDAMKGNIYTGPLTDHTPSLSGRNAIRQLLPASVRAKMTSKQTSNIRELLSLVASTVSLNVDAYGERL